MQEPTSQDNAPEATKAARMAALSGNDTTKDAIDLADRASRKISAYPHKLRTEPPLPHGFMEGALLGMAAYAILRPVRFLGRKYIRDDMMKNMFGMIFTVGQVMASAQVALYGAVYKGSSEWLAIATDYTSAPRNNTEFKNVHKSILADDICQDPVVQKYLLDPRIETANKYIGEVTVMEWLQDPEKIMTEELFRTVKACRDRDNKKS